MSHPCISFVNIYFIIIFCVVVVVVVVVVVIIIVVVAAAAVVVNNNNNNNNNNNFWVVIWDVYDNVCFALVDSVQHHHNGQRQRTVINRVERVV